jgi:hypothetical protein
MPDLKITELTALASANLAATDPIAVVSLAGSDTKKITAKDFVQKAVTLIDDASIPSAKVSLSGISGTNLSAGTVAASKLDTSTIPATGGVTVSSSNLQLVAPTSPIVRNAGTGSLEHANSGVTAGTYTKVTVDSKGHVTVGAAVAAADLPIAISGTVGVMSPGTGLAVTGGGVLNHSSSVTAGTTTGFTYDAQGHITGAVALAGADLPIATSSVRGAVRPGTGLSVDGNGILDVTAATNAVLGGVIAGSDFSITTGTISLAAQAGIAAGQYTKVTVNSKGIATAGTVLSAGDIPNLAASQITSGSLDIARIAANTVTGAKVANYAVTKIGDTQPTADHIGQFFFNPLSRDLFLWDGNVFQPIGISVGEIVFAGTFDASAGGGTGHVASVTAEGTAIGLVEGSPLPAAATANNRYYLVVSESGTITSGNAPQVALAPPDIVLSTGIEWTEVDVSQTFTSVSASQVAFTPEGTIAANNVQAAIEEVNNEKLALAGGTVTGNLEIGTTGSISFEGSTANAFETTIAVVDPTADRTITLPNVSGTVVTTGDTGTVTSTMLLDGTILNEDINASAAIVDTKLATIATAGKVSNSATTAASANTASAIVARDASGNFTAGTITAALTGAASSNVLKAGDTMTGALVVPLASAATPSLTFTGDLNTGIYSPGADQVAVATNGTRRLLIDSAGALTLDTGDATIYGITVGRGAAGFIGNTVVGNGAFASNTGGSSNVAIGYLALRDSTTGSQNVAIGQNAMRDNTTGSDNTATGFECFIFNTTGNFNVANGISALRNNTTGTYNVAVGQNALIFNTTGGSNNAIGAAALLSNTTGSNNTCIGNNAGYDLTTGSSNTIIGNVAGTAGLAGTVIIGAGTTERLRIDSSGNVGIGSSSPPAALTVVGSAGSGDAGINIASGSTTMGSKAALFFIPSSSPSVTTGSAIKSERLSPDGSDLQFFTVSALGNTPVRAMTIDSSQRVGIGVTSPGGTLDVVAGNTINYAIIANNSYSSGDQNFLQFKTGSTVLGDFNRPNGTNDIEFNAGFGAIAFGTGTAGTPSERARIDSSGRLLVGTSSGNGAFYDAAGDWQGLLQVARSNQNAVASFSTWDSTASTYTNYGGAQLHLSACKSGTVGTHASGALASGDTVGSITFSPSDGSSFRNCARIEAVVDGGVSTNDVPGRLVFSVTRDGQASPEERMRISQGGNIRMFAAAGNGGLALALTDNSASGQDGITLAHSATGIAGSGTVSFRVIANGNVTNTNNSYGAISDAKLKENIVDATSQWNDLKALQVRKYNFKEGQTHTQIGLIAQEVELVSPGLVSESPDRDAEGNDLGTVTKSVNYSVLYMKAVKALQEAMERIEALEADVAQLKGA